MCRVCITQSMSRYRNYNVLELAQWCNPNIWAKTGATVQAAVKENGSKSSDLSSTSLWYRRLSNTAHITHSSVILTLEVKTQEC